MLYILVEENQANPFVRAGIHYATLLPSTIYHCYTLTWKNIWAKNIFSKKKIVFKVMALGCVLGLVNA